MTKLIYPQGSWVAIVTPFDENLEIDLAVMRDLVDFHAANNTSTLLIMGSTGEPTMLTLEERKRIIKEMAAYCKGKIHAFFGVTLGSTAMTIDLARYAQEQDADGIVIVVPPYLAPPQDAVFTYLKAVCLAVDISVGLYNNPARVIANVDPATIVRLFHEVPNLVADKEAMPSVGQLAAVYDGTEGRLSLLCCDSPAYGLVIPTLGLGGRGRPTSPAMFTRALWPPCPPPGAAGRTWRTAAASTMSCCRSWRPHTRPPTRWPSRP